MPVRYLFRFDDCLIPRVISSGHVLNFFFLSVGWGIFAFDFVFTVCFFVKIAQ